VDTTSTIIFVIAAFSLGGIILMQRNNIPASMRRGMAITAIVFIAFAFFLVVYSLTNVGS
jgi:preprotein translocase subunit SecG